MNNEQRATEKENEQRTIKEVKDGHFMVREHQYIFVSFFNHHGFLSDRTGECAYSVVEKGIGY